MNDSKRLEIAIKEALKNGMISNQEKVSLMTSWVSERNVIINDSKGQMLAEIPLERVEQLSNWNENFWDEENDSDDWGTTGEIEEVSDENMKKAMILRKERKEKELEKINKLREKGVRFWEYKHIRLDYKGRGITQEINILDIDGERLRGWTDNFSSNEVPTLPELFEKLGNDGWEMVSHVVNQDVKQNGVTLHYYNFKREKL